VLPARLDRIIALLARLPGVGEKTAQRYALFLLTADPGVAEGLGEELVTLREHLCPCALCGNIAEVGAPGAPVLCEICADNKRDARLLCVVARVQDLLAIERAGTMRGRYFVLGKLLSPLEGVGPEELPLEKLFARVKGEAIREVIVATPPSVDGEATALLLKRELAPLGVALTRIASGVPHGGDLEFADPVTMGRALAGRQHL
jgi:recombination protein RecR